MTVLHFANKKSIKAPSLLIKIRSIYFMLRYAVQNIKTDGKTDVTDITAKVKDFN